MLASYNGHTCVAKRNLIEFVSGNLEVDEDTIEDNLINLKAQGMIVIEKQHRYELVYLEPLYRAEYNIAQKIIALKGKKQQSKEYMRSPVP